MKDIDIEWKGESFIIKEDEAFELAERIEEIVSISELAAMSVSPKFTKLSRCYAEMINFAGGKATPREVHQLMMAQIKNNAAVEAELATVAVTTLVAILMDGAPEDDEVEPETGEAKSSSKAAT